MNKLYSAFVLVALVASTLAVGVRPAWADGWAQMDSSTGDTLFGFAANDDVRVAVGADGTVVYSHDNGVDWSVGDSGVSVDLYDVAMTSESEGVAIGQDGTILVTSDGGDDWSPAEVDYDSSSSQGKDLRALAMATSTVGYITGESGVMFKTTNGGESWYELDSPTSTNLNSLSTHSSSYVWAAGENGTILVSTNGGSSWSSKSSGTSNDLVTVFFADTSNGFASGENRTFLISTNGGSTWTSRTVDELDSDEYVVDIGFYDEDNGILTSGSGDVFRTDDGGSSWDEMDVSGSPNLLDVYYLSSSELWGVGEDGDIYRYDTASPDAPSNFQVSGDDDDITDTTPSFSWSSASDEETDVDYYMFKMDSGSYENVGSGTSYTYDHALSNGTHTAYLYAVDEGGNASSSVSLSFTVDADSSSSTAPDVSTVTPTTAVKGQSVTYSVRISDDDQIESCDLYVDGDREKSMYVETDVAYASLTISSNGTYEIYARCTDDEGKTMSGGDVDVVVSSVSPYVSPGNIIKLACTGNVYVNHPCTAVYYYGKDGKRHAFTNESVFFSWFNDYDDLVVLSDSAMASIALGRNVVYRPGGNMVKFSTSAVYAVSYLSVLRPIENAGIAQALYGSNWTSDITVVNDVFYSNYRVGSTIESSSDFSASDARAVTSSIDATF